MEKYQSVKGLYYEITLEQTDIGKIRNLDLDRLWIIFAGYDKKLTNRLRELLREQRQFCVIVEVGQTFKKQGEESYEINPHSKDDFRKLFADISHLAQLEGVIYLWGEIGSPDLSSMEKFHSNSFMGFVNLVVAIDYISKVKPPKILVVTYSSLFDGTLESLFEYPVNALCKLAYREYPQIPCSYLALDRKNSAEDLCSIILKEMLADSSEQEIYWREGGRLAPRLERKELTSWTTPHFIEECAYMIIGGSVGLALEAAKWYISHGAKHIILVDSIEATNESAAAIAELSQNGADITLYTCNYWMEGPMQELMDQIKKKHPPLKGLIFLPLIVDDELMMNINWDHFIYSYQIRLQGSWQIHQVTKHLSLDHFILFSSTMTNFYPIGKSSQSVCTSFLDVLSHYRRKEGLPALTIDWGAWSLKDVMIKRVIDIRLFNTGFNPITQEQGFLALDTVFYNKLPEVVVADIDWQQIFALGRQPSSFFSNGKYLGIILKKK